MLNLLNQKNSALKIYSVRSEEFKSFGRVIENIDTSEFLQAAKKAEKVTNGSKYLPSLAAFEELGGARQIKNEFFGTLPTQIGYCWGYNSFLNAAEWHFSSEINIAVTDLVLILGHIWDFNGEKIDSSKFKAFFIEQGTAVEVYATSLHFCPCQVESGGFGCVVALPEATNTELEEKVQNPLLFKKNKWIVAHVDNKPLIERGVKAAITGENYEIKY